MYSQLQASYHNVDQCLTRLTDSIAAYNPSASAAEELLAADEAVNADLEQLVTHQRNHQTITELNRIIETNNESLKRHFRQILQLRKELASLPSYDDDSTAQQKTVEVDELLRYAKFISKTTVPPTYRAPASKPSPPPPPHKSIPAEGEDTTMTNGTHTPLKQEEGLTVAENVAVKAMNAQEKSWLDPLANVLWEPWPSHLVIQNGALGSIQRLIEKGVDPAAVLSPEEQAEADRKKREQDERERLEQEERERRRMSMFDVGRTRQGPAQDDVFDPDA